MHRYAALLALALLLPGCAGTREGRSEAAFPALSLLDAGTGEARGETGAAILSAAWIRRGYWSSRRFLREVGAGIYALAAYDPARTPILFVHGAAGSPRDWRYFVAHIDRSRYQPWLFYYPSGARIEEMSEALYRRLAAAQEKHHPGRIYITAHSQGGLVVRALLGEHGRDLPAVKLFVSISTPWSGERLARLGARLSPVAVPSWKDLCPRGPFLRALFTKPLPPWTEYDLLFSHRGGRGVVRPNNDGAVTLASQLRPEAQAEARRVYGFDESHTGILSAPEVLALYNGLLRQAEGRAAAEPDVARAR